MRRQNPERSGEHASDRSHRVLGLVATLSVAIALAGCAAMQQSVGGWFGAATPTATPAPTPAAKGAAAGPRVYYTGAELKVYSGPSASSKVVGELALHEKVTRSKLERGFAYVESGTSGLKGWVVNAQLIWRLPSEGTAPGGAAAEPEPEAPAAEEEVLEAPEATATSAEAPATPTNTPAAAPPTPKPTPRGVAPSIFDAY